MGAWPCEAALWRGVSPSASARRGSAPAANLHNPTRQSRREEASVMSPLCKGLGDILWVVVTLSRTLCKLLPAM
jgi:hypothetical protein